jgi:hypothetical protein
MDCFDLSLSNIVVIAWVVLSVLGRLMRARKRREMERAGETAEARPTAAEEYDYAAAEEAEIPPAVRAYFEKLGLNLTPTEGELASRESEAHEDDTAEYYDDSVREAELPIYADVERADLEEERTEEVVPDETAGEVFIPPAWSDSEEETVPRWVATAKPPSPAPVVSARAESTVEVVRDALILSAILSPSPLSRAAAGGFRPRNAFLRR